MILKKDIGHLTIGDLTKLRVGDSLELRGVNQGLSNRQIGESKKSLQLTVNDWGRKGNVEGRYNVSILKDKESYLLIERRR